jgi:hypothetical protein
MSIFVTGDIHGEIYPRFSNASFPAQKGLTKDDMARYFQNIMNRTQFRVWYFGHLHSDRILPWERATALYHRIMQIA